MKLRKTAIGLAAATGLLFSQDVRAGGQENIVITPIGDAFLQIGQIADGYYKSSGSPAFRITNLWQQQAYAHVGYDALINKRLDINISVGGSLAFSSPQILGPEDAPTLQTHPLFLINTAYASYPVIQDSRLFSLTLQGGYFPYKYNPDVRNLGEYLFRTNTYPMLVYSTFDYPEVRLLGARAGMEAFDALITNDLLLHSELLGVPVQDWSIADIFNLHLFHMLDLGGGVDFTHLLSVYQGPYSVSSVSWYNYFFNVNSGNNSSFIIKNGSAVDTLNWQSTKLMGRFSFDPKGAVKDFFNNDISTIFGKDECKLYGEADIIGVKNYPGNNVNFAELANRNMRTLYSLGINVPTHKILDVLNVEVEYCADTTSAFSDEQIMNPSLGAPSLAPVLLSLPDGSERSPWRWSVYLKKSVYNDHVSFIAQFARDHTKIDFNYWDQKYMSFMETLPTSKDWWWSFKTEVKF